MKIFIVQSICSESNNEIERVKKVRELVKRKLTMVLNRDIEFVNEDQYCANMSMRKKDLPQLMESINLLKECDAVYYCKYWDDSSECRIIHKICSLYEIPTLDETAFLLNDDYEKMFDRVVAELVRYGNTERVDQYETLKDILFNRSNY